MKKKIIVFICLIVIICGLVCLSAWRTSNGNKKAARVRDFPSNTIELKEPLRDYVSVTARSNIEWLSWGPVDLAAQVKENNPFQDYWTCADESVVVELDYLIAKRGGQIFVRSGDADKIPKEYSSDKISVMSVYNFSDSPWFKPVFIDLTPQELQWIHRILFDEELNKSLERPENIILENERIKQWDISFHVKDLENLCYQSNTYTLCHTTDGRWFVTNGYHMLAELPVEVATKIEEAVTLHSSEQS